MVLRNGYQERVWRIKYVYNMFDCYMFIKGTEPEMQDYIESEMPYVGAYRALNPDEEAMIERLEIKVYLAPKKEHD